MKSKYMKSPGWVKWKDITKRITAARRKKEFLGRLKHGKRFGLTDDPGP